MTAITSKAIDIPMTAITSKAWMSMALGVVHPNALGVVTDDCNNDTQSLQQ
jgi:hypothetical protein